MARIQLIDIFVAAASVAQCAELPFVGCPSEGQLGPQPAPTGKSKAVSVVPNGAAEFLAYYQMNDGTGVIAPRGWHCLGSYGSGGSSLAVSPEPIAKNTPLTDAALVISYTSGRFHVAEMIARLFPRYRSLIPRLLSGETDSPLPSGTFPSDKLVYWNRSVVVFATPAQTEGLGVHPSWLAANDQPIRGVVRLSAKALNVVELRVRMPERLQFLSSTILWWKAANP